MNIDEFQLHMEILQVEPQSASYKVQDVLPAKLSIRLVILL